MKKYKSNKEGQWFEVIQFTLSEEQKELLASRKPSDIAKQTELRELISSKSIQSVDAETINNLINFYDSIRPKDRNYKLISCDIYQNKEKTFSGILNYRINNEHKQLRFQ